MHRRNLAPGWILDDEPVPHAQHLAVDVVDGPAGLVGDVEVVAQVENPLTNEKHAPHSARVRAELPGTRPATSPAAPVPRATSHRADDRGTPSLREGGASNAD